MSEETARTPPPENRDDAGGADIAAPGLGRVDFAIGGMTCSHCPGMIEKALDAIEGVAMAHVNPATGIAVVDYDPERADAADLVRAIHSAGYTAGAAKMRIPLENMHCASCVTRVEEIGRASCRERV